MNKFVHALGFAFLACSLTAACGGSDNNGGGGGGGAVDSGVPGDKQGQDLTQAEVTRICEAVGAYADSKLTDAAACRVVGVLGALFALGFNSSATEADLKAACDEAVTACLEEPAQEDSCADEPVPTSCTSTVQEIETCAKDSIDQGAEFLGQFPNCAEVTKAYLESLENLPEPETPASCATVEQNCPSVLADDETAQ
jgi:hypothetical protein